MMSSSKQKILVVDDEESLCEIIQFNLEVEGYTVDTAFKRCNSTCLPTL